MPISTIFHTILQMTATASLCILAVLLIRILLKKAPRVFSYALWSVVLFRLLCPFSFESVLSLIPSAQVVEPTGQAGLPFQVSTNIPVIDTPVNEYLGSHYYEGVTVPADFSLDLSLILGTIWLVGCLLLLGFSLISFVKLRIKLRGAVWVEANIYHAKGLETAFVLGVFRPKIYLPEGLSEKEQRYILLHEQTHIRRKDYLIRLAAFAALCLHWFNPLVWLAFFMSSRDMEMSCDEAVLKKLGNEVKKDYSTSLLSLASGRRWVGGTPLAFGEGDTKSRIKNVLSYRKPAFWVLVAAVIAVAAAVFLLAANPKESDKTTLGSPFGQEYEVDAIPYQSPQISFHLTVKGAPRYQLTEQHTLLQSNDSSLGGDANTEWTILGTAEPFELTPENFDDWFVFLDEEQEQTIRNLRKNAVQAWRVQGEGSETCYILQCENQEGIYLALGKSEDELAASVFWLFALTPVSARENQADILFSLRTEYIGNNSAVGNLLDALDFPQPRGSFSLKTDAQPYGLTVNFAEDAPDLLPYEKNAVLLLALIDNADEIAYQFSSEALVYDRTWAEEWLGIPDVRVKSAEELSSLLEKIDGKGTDPQPSREESVAEIEASCLQYVLNNTEFTNGNLTLSLPGEVPQEHPLEIIGNIRVADGAGGFTSYDDLFAEQNETGWEAGKTYSALAAPDGWTEGSTVSILLWFYEEHEENGILPITRWYASWVYQDGKMVRQPWAEETTVGVEQLGQQWTLSYTEPHGREFSLTLTLPENWQIVPENGMPTGGQANILDELGQSMGTIIQNIFTYYPEAAGENFPISVYSDQMLSSMTYWGNEYTPVKQGRINADGVAVTETATVLIQRTDNGAAGPIIEMPGILSYNLDILRYVAISFAETVPRETATEIANSINLR